MSRLAAGHSKGCSGVIVEITELQSVLGNVALLASADGPVTSSRRP
jgi:hypothetical protein